MTRCSREGRAFRAFWVLALAGCVGFWVLVATLVF